MGFSIYTYSNPYELNRESFWSSIKDCPHFCVSQTMANGVIGTYVEMTAGKVSTVEHLVKAMFEYWESTECKIKQYTAIDVAIERLVLNENEQNIKQSLRFNRKALCNSLRILFELNMDLASMKLSLMTAEQKNLVNLYEIIAGSDLRAAFELKREFSEKEVEEAIRQGMLSERNGANLENIDMSTIVVHGVHQFSPIILLALEHIAVYKNVLLLFNYQAQYKNVYQTWVDVYTSFDLPIQGQSNNEFRPNPLLINSYAGNRLADQMASLIEGRTEDAIVANPVEVIEFDNNTEFASYVAHVYEEALRRQEKALNPKRSTLYYMPEQFYAANNSVNNILKVYYPGQFGERHFLSYPIGHFFLSITSMWNATEGGLKIENMNDVVECLNSGFIKEKHPGTLCSIFNRTQEFFARAETIDQIVELLGKLKKRIRRASRDSNENRIGSHLVYFNVSNEEIEQLSDALKQLNQMARVFYADFEDTTNNFQKFYKKIKEFLETRVLEAEDLEEDFRDVIQRVLIRLEEVENLEMTGSFDVLKETMSYYLQQEKKKGSSANWIVRDFEQIDGDILKSDRQHKDTVYHFACLSDTDMNVTRRDRFPWPLDTNFFEVAQDPVDWKYQVYVKSRREYKNFKRYALIYGMQFNRVKFKLSYVKNTDDRENELFYLLKILGAKKIYPDSADMGRWAADNRDVGVDSVKGISYGQNDYSRYKLCRYRFLLESTIEMRTVYRDHFLLLKYLEILLENAVRRSMQGQIATEEVMFEALTTEYGRLENKFEFVRDMHSERMDIVTNARNFLQKNILKKQVKFPKLAEGDEAYMRKKEEFIYLQLNGDNGRVANAMKNVDASEINRVLQVDKLDAVGYSKSYGAWCKWCAVREICLDSYKYRSS